MILMAKNKIKIKKIDAMSVGKIMGLLYAIIGFIIGAFFSLFAVLRSMAPGEGIVNAMFGILAIVFLPLFYGVLGFVGGIITAWLYNVLAGSIGGVILEIE